MSSWQWRLAGDVPDEAGQVSSNGCEHAWLRFAGVRQVPEASWPPLAMFRALLLAVWHDLSDVKLAEALDDRASFRRFCGFARTE